MERDFEVLGTRVEDDDDEVLLVKDYIRRRTSRHALHQNILKGDIEGAINCLSAFTREELQADKIEDSWALHCLPPQAFHDKVEQTKTLILKYIESGWDVNAETGETLADPFGESWICLEHLINCCVDSEALAVSDFTLLHLACFYKSHDMITLLVAHGADPNKLTGRKGNIQLSPLHISIMCEELESAYYLLENGSSPESQGYFDIDGFKVTEDTVIPSGESGDLKKSGRFTALQLGLKVLNDNGDNVELLERMLEGGSTIITADDLYYAIEGALPGFVHWLLSLFFKCTEWSGPVLPMRIRVLHGPRTKCELYGIVGLLETLIEPTYNNLGQNDGSLLFQVLDAACTRDGNSIMLRKLLQLRPVALHVRNAEGKTPVEFVLARWDEDCGGDCYDMDTSSRLNPVQQAAPDAVILLIQHGADVSGLEFGPSSFNYHNRYEKMVKVMYAAGPKFEKGFSQPENLSGRRFWRVQQQQKDRAREELRHLREWIQERQHGDRLNLQFAARIAVRKLLKTIGHLTLLDCLPPKLKDQVLCKSV